MNKRTNKKQNYNQDILEALADKFGFTIDYIRKCLRGDRSGIMADKLKTEYDAGVKRLTKTIETFKTE